MFAMCICHPTSQIFNYICNFGRVYMKSCSMSYNRCLNFRLNGLGFYCVCFSNFTFLIKGSFFYQIKFRQDWIIRLIHPQKLENLSCSKTFIGSKKLNGSIKEFVNCVDVFAAWQDILAILTSQWHRLELNLRFWKSDLRARQFSKL